MQARTKRVTNSPERLVSQQQQACGDDNAALGILVACTVAGVWVSFAVATFSAFRGASRLDAWPIHFLLALVFEMALRVLLLGLVSAACRVE